MSYRSDGLIKKANHEISESFLNIDEALSRCMEDGGELSTDSIKELADIHMKAEALCASLGALLEEIINQLETNQETIH